jgi:hypothetical protein
MRAMEHARSSTCSWQTVLGLVIAAAGALTLGQSAARAADVETRFFTINVDGKKSGDYKMVIQRQGDGTVTLSAQSEVRVTILAIPVYTFSYRGSEVWKAGRLQHFESTGKEKGKDFTVRADLDGADLRVVANGQEHRVRADAWLSSCWQLPEARYRNNNVVLLGCDNGSDHVSRLDYVGKEQIKVAGQMQTCTHYRVTKDAPHDLWYDAEERLVRDEWMSTGHKTVLELMEVR